jgi:hypothetical protein
MTCAVSCGRRYAEIGLASHLLVSTLERDVVASGMVIVLAPGNEIWPGHPGITGLD